jgi:XTP/dITP diphosphohydrolase
LEAYTVQAGKNLKEMTLKDMDAIWHEAKKQEL